MSSAVMLQWMRQLRVLLLFPTIAPSVREPRASPNPSRDVWASYDLAPRPSGPVVFLQMMQDVAKWFCLFAVMLIGFAGTLRVLFSTPDAAHLLEGTPDFCFERQDGTGQVTYVFSWAFRLFEAMFNLGNLQDCLRASSWGRAISYFFLLFIYVVMLNLCVTPPLILGLGGPCVQHVDTGGACAPHHECGLPRIFVLR